MAHLVVQWAGANPGGGAREAAARVRAEEALAQAAPSPTSRPASRQPQRAWRRPRLVQRTGLPGSRTAFALAVGQTSTLVETSAGTTSSTGCSDAVARPEPVTRAAPSWERSPSRGPPWRASAPRERPAPPSAAAIARLIVDDDVDDQRLGPGCPPSTSRAGATPDHVCQVLAIVEQEWATRPSVVPNLGAVVAGEVDKMMARLGPAAGPVRAALLDHTAPGAGRASTPASRPDGGPGRPAVPGDRRLPRPIPASPR